MNKLKTLLSRCKCGVILRVNEHNVYCETPDKTLEYYERQDCPPDISVDVKAKILETGNVIDLILYPDTPIGSYHIVHYDLDAALDMALACLDQQS